MTPEAQKKLKRYGFEIQEEVLDTVHNPSSKIEFVRILFSDILGRPMDFSIPSSELIDGHARGLEHAKSVGPHLARNHRLHTPICHKLSRLDTRTARCSQGRVLDSLQRHGLHVHKDKYGTATKDWTG